MSSGQFCDAEEDNYVSKSQKDVVIPFQRLTVNHEIFSDLSDDPKKDFNEDNDSDDDVDEEDDDDTPDEDDNYDYEEIYTGHHKYNQQTPLVTSGVRQHSNAQQATQKLTSYQPSDKLFKKYTNRINVEQYDPTAILSNQAANKLVSFDRRQAERIRVKDKNDRATAEQVMDPRTRMILFKLLNRGIINEINGCISTGKEANVYHATGKNDLEYAIKIYKTSILVFKDRDRYVSG